MNLLAVAAVGVCIVTGCSLRNDYELITFLFTGVPPLEELQAPTDVLPPDEEGKILQMVAAEEEEQQPEELPPALYKHAPFAENNCDACHNPGGANQLFTEPRKLCFRCHEDFGQSFPWVHGPVAVGFCNACHEPHQSKNEFLLVSKSGDICFKCHLKQDIFATTYHEAARSELCVGCHDPHGSTDRWLLKEGTEPLKRGLQGIQDVLVPPDSRARPDDLAGYEEPETRQKTPGI